MPEATQLGPQWTIRAFDPNADVPAVARLLAAVEAHDQDGDQLTEDALRGRLTEPGHDPARDQWVAQAAERDSEVVGWGYLWKAPENRAAYLDGAVHPHWRGHGMGGALLRRALERVRELGAPAAGCYAGSRNIASDAFLQHAGFHPVSANTLLRVPGTTSFPEPSWPAGFTLRPYPAVNSVPLLTQAFTHCFAGLWGHNESIDEKLVAEWLPEMDTDGIFFVFAPDGGIAGMCRAEMSAAWTARTGVPAAYVDAPGVVPGHRADGLYLPLLLAALAWLREKAPATILLESWGDAEETLALYESVGFMVKRRSVAYEMDMMR